MFGALGSYFVGVYLPHLLDLPRLPGNRSRARAPPASQQIISRLVWDSFVPLWFYGQKAAQSLDDNEIRAL